MSNVIVLQHVASLMQLNPEDRRLDPSQLFWSLVASSDNEFVETQLLMEESY